MLNKIVISLSSVMLLSLLCQPQTGFADTVLEQYFYERTFGAETTTMSWQRLDGTPEQIRTEIRDEIDQTEMDSNFATKIWKVEDQQQQTDLQIQRKRDRLHLTGRFKGEQIDSWEEIDTAPWFQTMSISFRPFLNSRKKSIKFWIVRPDTLGIHKLRAVKRGVEELTIEGQTIQAEKLELRLAGLGAPFWKANYWFRRSDHLFLRYVGPGGLPGTPKIVVEIKDLKSPVSLANRHQ